MSNTYQVPQGAVLAKIAQHFPLPEFVKRASIEELTPPSNDPSHFAQWGSSLDLPMHNKAACWLSCARLALGMVDLQKSASLARHHRSNGTFTLQRLVKRAEELGLVDKEIKAELLKKEGLFATGVGGLVGALSSDGENRTKDTLEGAVRGLGADVGAGAGALAGLAGGTLPIGFSELAHAFQFDGDEKWKASQKDHRYLQNAIAGLLSVLTRGKYRPATESVSKALAFGAPVAGSLGGSALGYAGADKLIDFVNKESSTEETFPVRSREEAVVAQNWLLKAANTGALNAVQKLDLANKIVARLQHDTHQDIRKMAGIFNVADIDAFGRAASDRVIYEDDYMVGSAAELSNLQTFRQQLDDLPKTAQTIAEFNQALPQIIRHIATIAPSARIEKLAQHMEPLMIINNKIYKESALRTVPEDLLNQLMPGLPFGVTEKTAAVAERSANLVPRQIDLLEKHLDKQACVYTITEDPTMAPTQALLIHSLAAVS